MAQVKKFKKSKIDAYQVITDSIIEALEKGVKPWVCPWDNSNDFKGGLPKNLKSNVSYSGINIVILWSAIAQNNYTSPYFLTYNQAVEMGGNVLKGSKGTKIIYYKMLEITDKITDEEKKLPMLKTFTVFNLDQIEGIEAPKPLIKSEDEIKPKNEFIVNEDIEKIVNSMFEKTGVKFIEGGNSAFYSPSNDSITMPDKEKFVTYDDYCATKTHELIHSTSHKTRCNRDLKGSFGSKDYAFEELVAELGSAFCGADLGITGDVQHVSYISSWLERLNNDKRFIFKAATLASKAHKFLFEIIKEEAA